MVMQVTDTLLYYYPVLLYANLGNAENSYNSNNNNNISNTSNKTVGYNAVPPPPPNPQEKPFVYPAMNSTQFGSKRDR